VFAGHDVLRRQLCQHAERSVQLRRLRQRVRGFSSILRGRNLHETSLFRERAAAAVDILLRSDVLQTRSAVLRRARSRADGGSDLFHTDAFAADLSDRMPDLSVIGTPRSK
jgi:hypothetical protein